MTKYADHRGMISLSAPVQPRTHEEVCALWKSLDAADRWGHPELAAHGIASLWDFEAKCWVVEEKHLRFSGGETGND